MEKKILEIFLHYRQLFIKDNVLIGEWEIFVAEVFLHYSQFFIKGNFIIGRVECNYILIVIYDQDWRCGIQMDRTWDSEYASCGF